jgi:hypothetical protein
MSATKVIAFLLMLASLVALLFFGLVAVAGPMWSDTYLPPPPPLGDLSPGCLGLVMFAASVPFAAVPGFAGLGLWLFVVRKQEVATEQEVAALPQLEASFQARLDGLTQRLLETDGESASLAAELPIWGRDLDNPRRNRLLRFLAECGAAGQWGRAGLVSVARADAGTGSPAGCTRAVVLGLFAFGAFCLLWAVLAAYTHLATDVGRMAGLKSGPEEAAVGFLGCFFPGLVALFGGFALRGMLRREAGRRRERETVLQRVREIVLESCLGRAQRLLQPQRENASPVAIPAIASRLARACVVCALPELDGAGKGRLISQLQTRGLLARLALDGADLRGALLSEADLSSAVLTGADLSSALLNGTRLLHANLQGSRLSRADLRSADASGADLRNADLRQARMHRIRLRQADLRGANLEGANLWQADLTDAALAGALGISPVPSGGYASTEVRP